MASTNKTSIKAKVSGIAMEERSTEGNYPKIVLTMQPQNHVHQFAVDIQGYLMLLQDVHTTMFPLLSRQGSGSVHPQQFFAFGLMLYAKRMFDIISARTFQTISVFDEPLVAKLPIPRPIYSYLSSLGDIYIDVLGLKFAIDTNRDHVRDIVANALAIATMNDYDLPQYRWRRVLPSAAHARSYWISKTMTRLALRHDPGDLLNLNTFQATLHQVYGDSLTQDQANALGAYIFGLHDNPPIDDRGAVTLPAGFNQMHGDLRAAIMSWHEVWNKLEIPSLFFCVNTVDRGVTVDLHQGFCSAMTSLVPAIIRCSAAMPQTLIGSPALLSYVVGTSNAYMLFSPLQMPPSHIAMAFACRFRTARVSFFSKDGFSTTLTQDSPQLIRRNWVNSAVIPKGH